MHERHDFRGGLVYGNEPYGPWDRHETADIADFRNTRRIDTTDWEEEKYHGYEFSQPSVELEKNMAHRAKREAVFRLKRREKSAPSVSIKNSLRGVLLFVAICSGAGVAAFLAAHFSEVGTTIGMVGLTVLLLAFGPHILGTWLRRREEKERQRGQQRREADTQRRFGEEQWQGEVQQGRQQQARQQQEKHRAQERADRQQNHREEQRARYREEPGGPWT